MNKKGMLAGAICGVGLLYNRGGFAQLKTMNDWGDFLIALFVGGGTLVVLTVLIVKGWDRLVGRRHVRQVDSKLQGDAHARRRIDQR